MIKKFVLKQINKRGYEIVKPGFSDKTSVTLRKIMNQYRIDHVIDVGANEGQFAMGIRKLGFGGDISSFEPLSKVFEQLKVNSNGDNKWRAYNLALGNKDEQLEINVSKNKVSSSLLEILPEHIKQEPDSQYTGKEKINVKKIDTVWKEYLISSNNVYLKLDVQGYEKFVLEGAKDSFEHIKLIQVEMALIPLYKGELLLADMIRFMENLGYSLYYLVNGFSNFETGQLLQVDGIFARADIIR